MDNVFSLHEIERIVQRRRCKFHSHLVANLIQGNEVGGIFVLDGHTKADVLHAHFAEFFERCISALIAVIESSNLVVGLFQAFDGNPDAYLWKFFAQVNDTVCEESVGGDYDAVAEFVKFAHDVLQVRADEWFAAGDVGKIHSRQLLDGLN